MAENSSTKDIVEIKSETDVLDRIKHEETEDRDSKEGITEEINDDNCVVKTEEEFYEERMAENTTEMETDGDIMTKPTSAVDMTKNEGTEDDDTDKIENMDHEVLEAKDADDPVVTEGTAERQNTEVMDDIDGEDKVDKVFDKKEDKDTKERVKGETKETGTSQEQTEGRHSEWRVGKSEKYTHQPTSKEEDAEAKIGITEYLGSHSGFFGIIKQRYSDFVVNEVTSGGEIVHLTDKSIPPVPDVQPAPAEQPPELTPSVLEELDIMVGPPRAARITPHTDQGNKGQAEKTEVCIDVNNVTKEGRTNIHQAVKAKYGTKIISAYKEDTDGNKFIIIRKANDRGNLSKRRLWPNSHTYTNFVLYKENVDTIEAINNLAKYVGFGAKANMFAYAGTKDKRGKTSQMVSVPRVAPDKLCKAASFSRKYIHLGNFSYLPTPQKLGQLRGNKFHIVLREVKGDDEQIMSAIESLKTNGFINYFGSQRFSTSSVSTHFIGRELLKSNWHKAVNLILAPRKNEISQLNNCRCVWKDTGDAEAALKVLRNDRESSIEGKLLTGLKNLQKNDLVGALGLIPRNVRMLYLHAYQSYIWNMVVSRRIKKYGLKVLPGDIVRRKSLPGGDDDDMPEDECDDEDNHNGVEGNGTEDADKKKKGENVEGNGTEDADKKKKEENMEKKSLDISNFHFLTEEEAKTTDISDVLLPLPGYQIEYPKNEIKDWYVELLAADELSLSALKHRVRCYSIGGMYRRLVARVTDVSSCITYYRDPTKPLIQSDLDRLNGETVDDNLLTEGPYKAVIIEMTLLSSTYATMALRELLKMDTSSAFQTTLNEKSGAIKVSSSGNSRGYSGKGYMKRDYHDWDVSRGKGKRNWHSHSHHEGESSHQGFGGRGGGRGKGQKRPWRKSYNKLTCKKKRRVDLDF